MHVGIKCYKSDNIVSITLAGYIDFYQNINFNDKDKMYP